MTAKRRLVGTLAIARAGTALGLVACVERDWRAVGWLLAGNVAAIGAVIWGAEGDINEREGVSYELL